MVSSEAWVSIPKLCNGVARVGPSPLGESEGAFIFRPRSPQGLSPERSTPSSEAEQWRMIRVMGRIVEGVEVS